MKTPMCSAVRAIVLTGTLLVASALIATAVQAQPAFPYKTLRVVVGFSPGGSNDIIARLLAPILEAELGQTVVVENKPGASGNIAADYVLKGTPDGHMVFMCTTGTMSIQPFLPQPMPFDVKDITTITQIAKTPYLIVVNADLPVNSVPELIAYAKAHPGKLNFASSGNGGTQHLGTEMFAQKTGIDIVHVPYKGSGQALIDLAGGQVSLLFEQAISAAPHLGSGKIRALAVAGPERLAGLPDLPATGELGLGDFDPSSWTGLCTAPGVSADIVARWQQALAKALAAPAIQARFLAEGILAVGSTPAEFAEFLAKDRERWGVLAKQMVF